MLKVYNTLSKEKEEFRPIEKKKVKMYVCGPTVYDDCHIGHARSLIAFDTIRRYLEFIGYEVIYVQNFTDIDDKMIKRANEQNREIHELAEEYINKYYEDTKPLNIRKATYQPRATAVISDMIKIIRVLLEKGYAYNVEGNLYFNIMKFPSYGKLAGFEADEEEREEGAVCKVYIGEKKHKKDFALWKKKKENEPSWWSPWGEGRPGWHIECSTMSIKYLGNKIDIHGGGQDLIFPHHQNEIAQSEAYSGEKPFVKYWLHNGFVNIQSEKMSKSLGNFITIREALEKYPPEAIRFLLVSTHYRRPIDFNEDQVESSIRTLDKIYVALDFLEQVLRGNTNVNDQIIKKDLIDEEKKILEDTERDFIDAMNNDFDTHNAIVPLIKLVKYINGNMESSKVFSKEFISEAFTLLVNLGEILGLFLEYKNPLKERQNTLNLIDNLINIRDQARKEKNYKLADKIRDNIKDIGYILKDFKSFSLVQQKRE
ncbi:MAG: cysteine--tRNA ligase [Candidatus Lokiarchaeota archaeon]|nr:cysteine--tRNA ligase [Candidatus Lokiarchaeota archaeon]